MSRFFKIIGLLCALYLVGCMPVAVVKKGAEVGVDAVHDGVDVVHDGVEAL